MKKILFTLVLITAVGFSSFADGRNYMSIGGAYNKLSQTQNQVSPAFSETYTSYGLNMTGYSGKDIGFYSSVTFLLIQEFKSEQGTASATFSDLSGLDSKWGMDAQLGLAKKTAINEKMFLLAGAGLNYSQILMSWSDSEGYLDSFIFGILGVGGIAELALELFDGFYLSGMLRGGYNFKALLGDLAESHIDFAGGFTITPALGLAVLY